MTTPLTLIDDQEQLFAAIESAGELSPDGSYGLAQSFAGERQGVDEKTCSASFVIVTNEAMNRNGNGHILTKNEYGQGLMTKLHRQNPVVLFDHGFERSLPVALASSPTSAQLKAMARGRQDIERLVTQGASASTIDALVTDIETQLTSTYSGGADLGSYSVRVDEKQATSGAWFNQHDDFSMQLFGMVAQGFIRMASIGFQARKGIPIDMGKEKPQQGVVDFSRYRSGIQFTETELHEWSIVTIGADRGAFRQCLDRNRAGQEKLTPSMSRYLQRIVDIDKQAATTVTVAGSDIPKAVTQVTQRVMNPIVSLRKVRRRIIAQSIADKIVLDALAK